MMRFFNGLDPARPSGVRLLYSLGSRRVPLPWTSLTEQPSYQMLERREVPGGHDQGRRSSVTRGDFSPGRIRCSGEELKINQEAKEKVVPALLICDGPDSQTLPNMSHSHDTQVVFSYYFTVPSWETYILECERTELSRMVKVIDQIPSWRTSGDKAGKGTSSTC